MSIEQFLATPNGPTLVIAAILFLGMAIVAFIPERKGGKR